MSTPVIVATLALLGALVGVSCELAVRSLFNRKEKNTDIRIAKFLLGAFMAIKSIAFLSFHSDQGNRCYGTGITADLLYQLAMTVGNYILLARVQSIVPIYWKQRGYIFHSILSVLRIILGIVDVALISVSANDDGTCKYIDKEFWGPVYTLYDTLIDLYVTIMISAILISHIRALLSNRIKVSTVLYTSVICYNVIRTIILIVVNLISAIFIIVKSNTSMLLLIWPITNICFVVLVGYDSDVTKAIRDLGQKHWRSTSNSSTADLPRILFISRPDVKSMTSTSRSESDLGMQGSDNEIDNEENKFGDAQESVDLSYIQKYQSKTSLYLQTDPDDNCDSRRLSLPNTSSSNNATTATTSYTLYER